MVLAGAIYFKGKWTFPFKADLTAKKPFFVTPEKSVDTPMMAQTEHLRYAQLDGLQLLEMPYQGGQLALVALLPEKKDGLVALEKAITAEKVKAWRAAAGEKQVNVYLPKFTFASDFSLKDSLQSLGMKKAFGASADFSGMTGNKDLCLSQVLHKAFVEVNEEGTEAAAATAVVTMVTALPSPQDRLQRRPSVPVPDCRYPERRHPVHGRVASFSTKYTTS